jgi:DNA-binding NarL/FixJ family response regulator
LNARVAGRNLPVPPGITVFHCDDSQAFTRLVKLWLDDHEDIEHVGEAHSEAEALEMLRGLEPDVILLDTMGAPGDTALLERMRTAAPGARVLVYSGYVTILRPHELGGDADAYLAKGDDEAALVRAIRAVVRAPARRRPGARTERA